MSIYCGLVHMKGLNVYFICCNSAATYIDFLKMQSNNFYIIKIEDYI